MFPRVHLCTRLHIGRYVSQSEKEQRVQSARGCHGSVFALHALIWSIIPNSARTGVGRCCSCSCEIAIAESPLPRHPPAVIHPPSLTLPTIPLIHFPVLFSAPARKCVYRRCFNGWNIDTTGASEKRRKKGRKKGQIKSRPRERGGEERRDGTFRKTPMADDNPR